jgi:hypothetical protein
LFRLVFRTRWKTLGLNGQNRSSIHRESQSPLPELIRFGRCIGEILLLTRQYPELFPIAELSVLRKETSGQRQGFDSEQFKTRLCRAGRCRADLCKIVCIVLLALPGSEVLLLQSG